MAGAFSLFLGLLGLGAAGAVSAGQNAKIKKADYQYGEEHGLHGTSEVLQMRERVRKEWWSICGKPKRNQIRVLFSLYCVSQRGRGFLFYYLLDGIIHRQNELGQPVTKTIKIAFTE